MLEWRSVLSPVFFVWFLDKSGALLLVVVDGKKRPVLRSLMASISSLENLLQRRKCCAVIFSCLGNEPRRDRD
jgi:hypothetical protein